MDEKIVLGVEYAENGGNSTWFTYAGAYLPDLGHRIECSIYIRQILYISLDTCVCVCVSINKIPYSLTWIFNNATQRQAACCIGKISQNIHFNFICFFRTSFTFSFSLFYFPLPFVLHFSFICYGFHPRVDFFCVYTTVKDFVSFSRPLEIILLFVC